MGSCTRRHFLLSICLLQLLTIVERQVFDFLGYMWAPILANFFHIIFVIFGFFGTYQFRAKYITTYSIWNVLWIGWNVFLVCFYLSVGILDKNSDYLNLGTGSVSWFEVNGYGCKPIYPTNITSEDPFRPVRPERVDECLLNYPEVEIIHSGLQLILSILGIIGAILLARVFFDEDDRFDFMGGDAKSPQHTVVHPMYVSYSCIPTATNATILPKAAAAAAAASAASAAHIKSNTSNTNSLASLYNQNAKQTHMSFATKKPQIRYTELSTEQLVTDLDDSNGFFDNNYHLQNMKTFRNDTSSSSNDINLQNHGFVSSIRPNRNNIIHAYENRSTIQDQRGGGGNGDRDINDDDDDDVDERNDYNNGYDDRNNTQLINNFDNKYRSQNQQQLQQQQQQYHNQLIGSNKLSPNEQDEFPDNYIMPVHYVTRSPNLNRSRSRKHKDKHYVNAFDQIRDPPPGYDRNLSMQRVRSHDRLSHRKNSSGRSSKTRPRSYCSNGSFPEAL